MSSDGEASRPLISEVGLLRVEYADAAQELILSRAAAAIITPDDHDIGTGRSTRLASLAAAGIKHSAFREEREWRYVVTGGRPSERFRVSPTGLVIPYLDIPLNLRASLVSISVGPSDGQDQFRLEQRVAGVERLLAVHGLASAVEVVPSAIPFREI